MAQYLNKMNSKTKSTISLELFRSNSAGIGIVSVRVDGRSSIVRTGITRVGIAGVEIRTTGTGSAS